MNLSDLLPGVGDNTMVEAMMMCQLMLNQTPINLFHQVLQSFQMTPLSFLNGHLDTYGQLPSDGLLDRVAAAYLDQLSATSDELLNRFSPTQIREAIHRFVSYESLAESRVRQEAEVAALPDVVETCPFHFTEDGCVDETGSLEQALHINRSAVDKSPPHFYQLMAGQPLLVVGNAPAEGFHDQLARDYLTILETSDDPHDQLIREKFPLERMKECFHRWIIYEYQPPRSGTGW